MPPYTDKNVITQPIKDLPFSEDFQKMATINQWNTLEQLLSQPVSLLHKKEGFTMHMYDELITFLTQQGLMEKLKQRREA